MGLPNSFKSITENGFSRKWGGAQSSTVDPYISGYFHTNWAYIPNTLVDQVKVPAGPDGIENIGNIQEILRSSCLAVTLPGGTVNKAEFSGLGGIKWAAPTNVEFDNTVTVKFLEFSGLPIMSIVSGWVRLIRDYRAGVSPLKAGTYGKSNYAGTMYYWTTQPDGIQVEYAACISGMFPMKDPMDQFGGDLTTYDKLEMDIDFNADYVWRESWVYDRCTTLSAALAAQIETPINAYGATTEPAGA